MAVVVQVHLTLQTTMVSYLKRTFDSVYAAIWWKTRELEQTNEYCSVSRESSK
jgi:hypothetical protein